MYKINWHNPAWGEASIKCPHCGTGWDDGEGHYDSEYGYFALEEGDSTQEFVCHVVVGTGNPQTFGCGRGFRVTRTVEIKVDYKVE